VAVVGSMLAGQRYLSERCGDGVAMASGHRAASVLAAKRSVAPEPVRTTLEPTPTTGQRQRAGTHP
jgi:hypothetical protein